MSDFLCYAAAALDMPAEEQMKVLTMRRELLKRQVETARKTFEARGDGKDKKAKVEQKALLLAAERDLKHIDTLLEQHEVQTEDGVRKRLAVAEEELAALKKSHAGLGTTAAQRCPHGVFFFSLLFVLPHAGGAWLCARCCSEIDRVLSKRSRSAGRG